MKKIIFILTCIFLFANIHFCTAQNSKEPLSSWNFVEKFFVNDFYTVSKFGDDIKVKLSGNYTSKDSVFITQLVNDLKKIVKSINIDIVSEDQNFSLTINGSDKRMNLFDEGIKIGGGSSRDPINGKIGEMRVRLNFTDSIPQYIRNKAIQFKILRNIIPTNKLYTDAIDTPRDRNDYTKENINSDGIFSNSNYKDTYFNDFDKELITTVYSKNFYFNFYRKNPFIFFKYAQKNLLKNGGGIIMGPTNLPTNIGSIALIAYLILILKFYNFRKTNNNWLKICLNGIVLSMPLFILTVDEIIYLSKYKEFIAPTMLSIFIFIYVSILGFFSSSIYFCITRFKSFNNNEKKFAYVFQFLSLFISGLIGVFLLDISFEIANNYRNLLLIYILLISIIEISINIINDKSIRKIKEKELQLSKMEALKTKAELQAIQSRINPHFLYNSLNSIASLAISNPNKTREMALSLSEFCRFSLNKNNTDNVLIEDEIKMVSSYLEIEKIRFEDKLNFSVKIDEEAKKKYLPKFIIQPLIENAIKHGVSKTSTTCNIELLIEIENNGISINVIDDGPKFPETLIYGYGLQSIYDMLEILYSGEAKINWMNKPIKKISVWFPYINK